jgi:hypothetical protein
LVFIHLFIFKGGFNMSLSASLALAIAVLSLRHIIQSKILQSTDETNRQELAKRIEKLSLVILVPFGFLMEIIGIAAGYVFPPMLQVSGDGFISVGFTLILTSITSLIQSQSLIYTGDRAKAFGRTVGVYAWICFGVSIIALILFVYNLVRQ